MTKDTPRSGRRAEAIAAAIPADAQAVAEVGCDRGLVLDAILRGHPYIRIVGTDRLAGPVALVPPEIAARVELRVGEGFHALTPREVDGVVIAGMSAKTIVAILSERPEITRDLAWLVLCPSHFEDELRAGLTTLGWHPANEWLVFDRGRFYEVILARPGADPAAPDPVAARWGPRLLESTDPAVLRAWLADTRHRFREAFAAGLRKSRVGGKLASIAEVEHRVAPRAAACRG